MTEPSKAPPPTPATFAVFLITQGCLPAIFEPEAVRGQSPVEGHALTHAERAKIGLTAPGATIGYQIAGTDVFLDFATDSATVWFAGGDFTIAAILLEEMLTGMFGPDEITLRPPPPQGASGAFTREIAIMPRDTSRAALISMTFGPPDALGDARMFFARIYPQQRTH